MRRRDFIGRFGAAAAVFNAWPRATRAQQAGGSRRVGVLMGSAAIESVAQSYLAAFSQGLRQSGWTEGQNIRIDVRWSEGNAGLAPGFVAQLTGLMPDVILADNTFNLAAVRQANNTIPVVFVEIADPVKQGFVSNVRHPGGLTTGFSLLEYSLGGKWMDLLKQAAPGLTRVAFMSHPDDLYQKLFLPVMKGAAPSLGLDVTEVQVRTTADIEPALANFARASNGGVVLPGGAFHILRFPLIADLTRRYRLPSIASNPEFAESGGLLAYGPSIIDRQNQFRQAATYVDRILKGAKPGDLPVQAPTRYSFAINLKTAKTIGVDISPSLSALADRIIE